MAKEMKNYLFELLKKVDGLYCIIISDRDGVHVLKAADQQCPASAMQSFFLSMFGLAVDQGSKLGLGKMRTLISIQSKYQIIQMNKLPFILSFVASDSANTGMILTLEPLIDPILDELKNIIGES